MVEEKKIKIEFKNGDIRTINPIKVDVTVLTRYFSRLTDLIFDYSDEHLDKKITKALRIWLIEKGFGHPEAAKLIRAAECIIASMNMNNSFSFIAFTEEDNECLAVNLDPDRPYVWRISKMVTDDILKRTITADKRIVRVYLPQIWEDENFVTNVIQFAIGIENYELAALWRDSFQLYA